MRIWLLTLFSFFMFLPGSEANEFRFETHTYMPSLGMELRKDNVGALDMKETLEIGDISTWMSRLYINDDVRLSYMNFDYAGKKPLLSPEWDDLSVDSVLGLRYFGVGWFSPLIERKNFRAGILADLKAYRVSGQLGAFFREQEIIGTAQTSFSGIVPSFGIALQGNITENLFLYAEATGLPMGGYGSFWEADVGFQYKVKDHTFMQMGYKSHEIKTNNQFLTADLATRINGPYFGLNFSM